MPQRIQRKRTKGWRAPEGAINCTRPGKFGNPFKVGMWFRKLRDDWSVWTLCDSPEKGSEYGGTPERVRDLEHSLELFDDYAPRRLQWQPEWLDTLRGHDLMCWCALTSKCHVDIVLRLANTQAHATASALS